MQLKPNFHIKNKYYFILKVCLSPRCVVYLWCLSHPKNYRAKGFYFFITKLLLMTWKINSKFLFLNQYNKKKKADMKKLHVFMRCMWEFWPSNLGNYHLKHRIFKLFPIFVNNELFLPEKDWSNVHFFVFNTTFVLGNSIVFQELLEFKLLHAGIFCLFSCLVWRPL